jgi:hypothetical protein
MRKVDELLLSAPRKLKTFQMSERPGSSVVFDRFSKAVNSDQSSIVESLILVMARSYGLDC